mmetsp:Transcript_829/g.2191  ORF Transcript_829/g.2191 Transcript_829/m.2191 type:complete len:404 (-) Transcript_829:18-1229(-)
MPSVTIDRLESAKEVGVDLLSTFDHYIPGPKLSKRREAEPAPGLVATKVLLKRSEVREACLSDDGADISHGLSDEYLDQGLEDAVPRKGPSDLVAEIRLVARLGDTSHVPVVSCLDEGVLPGPVVGLRPPAPVRPASWRDLRQCGRSLRRLLSAFGDDRREFDPERPVLEQRTALGTHRVFGPYASHREGRVESPACRSLESRASHDEISGLRADHDSDRFAKESLADAGQDQPSTYSPRAIAGMPECQVQWAFRDPALRASSWIQSVPQLFATEEGAYPHAREQPRSGPPQPRRHRERSATAITERRTSRLVGPRPKAHHAQGRAALPLVGLPGKEEPLSASYLTVRRTRKEAFPAGDQLEGPGRDSTCESPAFPERKPGRPGLGPKGEGGSSLGAENPERA